MISLSANLSSIISYSHFTYSILYPFSPTHSLCSNDPEYLSSAQTFFQPYSLFCSFTQTISSAWHTLLAYLSTTYMPTPQKNPLKKKKKYIYNAWLQKNAHLGFNKFYSCPIYISKTKIQMILFSLIKVFYFY